MNLGFHVLSDSGCVWYVNNLIFEVLRNLFIIMYTLKYVINKFLSTNKRKILSKLIWLSKDNSCFN